MLAISWISEDGKFWQFSEYKHEAVIHGRGREAKENERQWTHRGIKSYVRINLRMFSDVQLGIFGLFASSCHWKPRHSEWMNKWTNKLQASRTADGLKTNLTGMVSNYITQKKNASKLIGNFSTTVMIVQGGGGGLSNNINLHADRLYGD